MTLVEATITLALLALILAPALGLMVTSREAVRESRAQFLARAAAEDMIERIKAEACVSEARFGGLAARYNNLTFQVPGLPPRIGGGAAGRVTVVLDEGDLDGVADASAMEMNFGSPPPDLDASGTTNVVAANGLYRVLPVRVEVFFGREAEPKVRIDALIAPRYGFRRTA